MKLRILYLVILSIIFLNLKTSHAQKEQKPAPAFSTAQCDCKAVKMAADNIPNITALYKAGDAEAFVIKLIQLLNKKQPGAIRGGIKVLPGTCAGKSIALATVCDGTTAAILGRYILYDDVAMTNIFNLNIGADLFVLAHEVGHHTHNHLHFDKITEEAKKQIEEEYKSKHFSVDKIRHIQELEADALAIWFLKSINPRIDEKKVSEIINGICNVTIGDTKIATFTHPSFDIRNRMASKMLANWETVFKESKQPSDNTRRFVIDELDSVLVEARDADITEIERILKEQAQYHRKAINLIDSAKILYSTGDYGRAIDYYENGLIQLDLSQLYTAKERMNVTESLKECQDKIKVTNFFAIYPLIGGIYTIPRFSSQSKPIDAAFKTTFSIGARAGLYNWTKKSWFELSVNYSKQEFSTLFINNNNTKNAVEHFSLNCLTAGLHYTFSTLANKEPSKNWKTGFVASAAPTYNYFFGNQYTNYINSENNREIDVKSSVGATLGLGIERISRKRNKTLGNFRVMANYTYQSLKFGDTVPVRQDFKGILHQISLTVSYRQW